MSLPFCLGRRRMLMRSAPVPVVVTLLVAAVFGSACGDDDGPADASPVDAAVDAGLDAQRPPPDGAALCTGDEVCADEIPCTRDYCGPGGFCRHDVDPSVCDDGIFCNGIEQCDPPAGGCVPARGEASLPCFDGEFCTRDLCDEEAKICRHELIDMDDDGEADWHCEGGTDCDDHDPSIASMVPEICDDFLDNDCDEVTDEPDCGRAPHDTCADALDVGAGGTFLLSTLGAVPDHDLGCGVPGRKDVVLRFTLTEPRDLRVKADGVGLVTAVALRQACATRDSELDCDAGVRAQVRARALPVGTYFILVNTSSGGEVSVEVELSPPTDAPAHESCAAPLDVSAGGRIGQSFVDVGDDGTLGCGGAAPGAGGDLVYSVTLAEESDLRVTAVADRGELLRFGLRSACDDPATEIRCVRGAPVSSRFHQLAAGTYYLWVEDAAGAEPDFSLDTEVLPPTPVPDGDTCGNAIVLPLNTPVTGTLVDKEDDHDLTCGFGYRDAVYAFTLAERSDVTLTAVGGAYTYVSIRPDCEVSASQLRCVSGNPSRARLRDLAAGTYYAIVESFALTSVEIEVATAPPTTAVAVSGNADCGSAYDVPATGGLFIGDTTGLSNSLETAGCGSSAASPDALFRIDLPVRRRVVATTEGSVFDTVLHMHQGTCTSGSELYCDDDGGDGFTSLLDRTLDPGTYFVAVDGWGTSSFGAYTFEVTVSEP